MPSGPGDVLDLIRRGRAATRGELLELTGLSRMTVAQRVDALLAAGLVVEDGTEGATGGRRSRRLVFNEGQARVACAIVETTRTRTAVTDLAGRVLVDDHFDVSVADGPERTLAAVATSLSRLLTAAGVGSGELCGIGVSLPGPVDPATDRPSQPPIMPGWDGYPVGERLRDEFGVAVLAANDADAEALGEHAAAHPDAGTLVLLKVSTGIGVGIVIDGQVYRGADGGAGDIGHIRLADHPEAVCQCGAHGCLAAVASGRAVAAELTKAGVPAASGRDVAALLAHGDPEATRTTRAAGRQIGGVLASVVCLLNPEVVVVGGALASAPLLAGLRESLYPLCLPRSTRHLSVHLGTLGESAAVVGLTRLVVDRQFAAPQVDVRLAAG